MAADRTAREPRGRPFGPGNNANPKGRPKGSRNKLGEAFIEALHEDWLAHGAAVIARVRKEKPDAYLKVVASILPKDINVRVDPFEHMTDEELGSAIDALNAAIYAETGDPRFAPSGADRGSSQGEGASADGALSKVRQ